MSDVLIQRCNFSRKFEVVVAENIKISLPFRIYTLMTDHKSDPELMEGDSMVVAIAAIKATSVDYVLFLEEIAPTLMSLVIMGVST